MANFFELRHKVAPEEIDGLGHVNNLVYLGWFMDAAAGHTRSAGMSGELMSEEGEGWVVRRHEIDYLAQVRPEDSVIIKTWIETAEKFRRSAGTRSSTRPTESLSVRGSPYGSG